MTEESKHGYCCLCDLHRAKTLDMIREGQIKVDEVTFWDARYYGCSDQLMRMILDAKINSIFDTQAKFNFDPPK